MNSLKEAIETNVVVPNNTQKRLVIDNISKSHEVYKIRLDQLYYNDQNDRIATWISQYKLENNISHFDISDKEVYNDQIHDFITDSNPEALRKTQTNIKLVGQQEPGVILADGRIIDGNRRVTCLRNIQKITGITQYFEAVILDHNIKNNEKQIKMLELMLQHGVDEKIGYNPIDRLVGIYNDIIEKGLLTVKEYANSVNQTEREINIEIEKAELLVEFLEFINAPKHFYLARTMNLTESLKDLQLMLKKVKDDDKKESLKNIVFAQLIMQPVGDMNRYIRRMKKVAQSTKFINDFIEEQTEIVADVCDELEKHPKVTAKEIGEIRSKDWIKENFEKSTEKFIARVDGQTTRNLPAKQVEIAFDALDSIDTKILKKLTIEQKGEIREKLETIGEILLAIKGELDE